MRQIAVLRPALSWLLAPSLLIVLTIAALPSAVAAPRSVAASRGRSGAVYTMTNAAGGNEVIAYRRSTDGSLDEFGRYATGGEGTGRTRLSSQGPVTLSEDGRWLFVANVGSDEISVFAVRRNKLRLVDVRPSGVATPTASRCTATWCTSSTTLAVAISPGSVSGRRAGWTPCQDRRGL